MIVLDTNVVSELFKSSPDARVVSWVSALADDVAITSITLAELLAGVRSLPDGKRKAALQVAIHDAMLPYRQAGAVLPFDDHAAEHYGEVLALRREAGLATSTADAQIAAICRAHEAVCATRNTKDFVEAGVELVNPWE